MMRQERQRAAAQGISRPCSEGRRAGEGRGVWCTGAGRYALHSQVSVHQQPMQQQRSKKAQRRAQQVSIDWPHAAKGSAVSQLLCASRGTA